MSKCYIATKFSNHVGFHAMREILEKAGHQVILDWTKDDVASVDPEERPRYLEGCAAASCVGAIVADVTIYLATSGDHGGSLFELGMALGSGRRAILVGTNSPDVRPCIFYNLKPVPGIFELADTMEEAARLVEPKPTLNETLAGQVPSNN